MTLPPARATPALSGVEQSMKEDAVFRRSFGFYRLSTPLFCAAVFRQDNSNVTKGRDFASAGASAASIVATVGRSFRLTRSAFSLSPLATKASLPKGLSDHRHSAFDFRLRRTRHWRGVALWNPSGPSPCCYSFRVAQYQTKYEGHTASIHWCGMAFEVGGAAAPFVIPPPA